MTNSLRVQQIVFKKPINIFSKFPSPISTTTTTTSPIMANQPTPPSPEPTTYIHVDAITFKDLVQKLTGGPGTHKLRPKVADKKRPAAFKLRERRKHCVRDLEIIKGSRVDLSVGKCSPAIGPETPAGCETAGVGMSESPEAAEVEEEKAIAEKRFYLHASPAGKAPPPVLLTLFPLTSQY